MGVYTRVGAYVRGGCLSEGGDYLLIHSLEWTLLGGDAHSKGARN